MLPPEVSDSRINMMVILGKAVLRGAKVFADADAIIIFCSVYQRMYVEELVFVLLSAPQTSRRPYHQLSLMRVILANLQK